MGTVAISNWRPLGDLRQIRGKAAKCKITMSNSYATGGDVLPIGKTEFQRVLVMLPMSRFQATVKWKGENISANGAGGAFKAAGTPTAPKIQSFVGDATPTETANATNLSTVSFDCLIIGQ